MKKMIALTLVLSAAAFAADLNVRVEGPSAIYLNVPCQFSVILEPTTEALLNGRMLMNAYGSATAEITNMSMDSDYLNATSGPDPTTLQELEGYYSTFVGLQGIPITSEVAVLTFDVTFTSPGDMTIGLYPHNVPQVEYALNATSFRHALGTFGGVTTPWSIPEPASLSLLAIGGLAVIRRR